MPRNQTKNFMAKTSSITLDVTPDGLKDPSFIDYLEKHDITFRVLRWNGPGGGNPYLELYATREELINFLRDRYFDGDEEEVEYFSTFIED